MADTNPANFANLPKEKVQVSVHFKIRPFLYASALCTLLITLKEIASMGGKASHGTNGTNGHKSENEDKDKENVGRREDGTFLPGAQAVKVNDLRSLASIIFLSLLTD